MFSILSGQKLLAWNFSSELKEKKMLRRMSFVDSELSLSKVHWILTFPRGYQSHAGLTNCSEETPRRFRS